MTNASNLPFDLPGHHDIRIIGPRKSGKSTFMAALARWANPNPDSPIQAIDPFDSEAAKLIAMARDILEDGKELAGTDYDDDANSLPTYTLLITLKARFLNNPLATFKGKPIRLQVSCREYSGELIKDLRSPGISSVNLTSYLDDCASAGALLLMIDGNARSDSEYAQAFDNLQRELNERLANNNRGLGDYRVAVVFAKCEQGQVWVHRQDVQKFVNLKFPQTQAVLQRWRDCWRCQVNYFFCSALGMKGTPPKPNVKVKNKDRNAVYAVIDKPEFWRPIGLVAPLYWLQTGQTDPRLREM